MIKNSAKFLPKLLEEIKELTYPKNLLRLVFMYGESNDNTLQILKDEKSKNILNIEVYKEPIDKELKIGGAQLAARIYIDFKRLMKDDEDYFLLLDSDLCEIPNDLIEKLIIVDADIVAPYPWSENKRHFYDSWVFRINNCRFSPQNPPGNNLTYPILVDSVGTCFLATREAWLTVPILNPYPNITFCNNARKLGYAVVAVPNIEVEHIDLELHGILHFPLSQEFGLYPNEGFIDSNFNVIPYIKKQISYESNLKIILDQLDKTAKEQLTNNNPEFIGKSEKWAKDRVFFRTFWCTQDPYLLNLLYKTEMYPPFIEVEISNICKYNCLHCEHKFWKEKPRLMNPEEFKMIIDQFPDLKWMAFT